MARRRDLLGDGLTGLCSAGLAVTLLLAVGLFGLLAYYGFPHFWPDRLLRLELEDRRGLLGIPDEWNDAWVQPDGGVGEDAPPEVRVRTANRDLTGVDFTRVETTDVREAHYPADAILLERLEWGPFFGWAREVRRGSNLLASGSEASWSLLVELLSKTAEEHRRVRTLEQGELRDLNHEMEQVRLEKRRLALRDLSTSERSVRVEALDRQLADLQARFAVVASQLADMRRELLEDRLVVESVDGRRIEVPVGTIVRALQPNSMSALQRARTYAGRIWEFLWGEPRESNTEGGIFPAIFGTAMMVFLMSFFVAPFGVLAAVYLREYARQGLLVRAIRIAVHNLAGVPSIVFGVFGLGFFVYGAGGLIDQIFFPEVLPSPTFGTGGILWASLTLALLTLPVVIVSTEEGLTAVPRATREASHALGATQFETTWRVVVPAAAPGVLTGLILAMARAAGEVAPLMVVGMVKLAPALPMDRFFPYVHLERKFMHLGFHIYDVGFQSPNVEATVPLVYATALLLVVLVAAMSLVAIVLRARLRSRYRGSAV
jgi:phosphate transport system permease protein